MTESTPAEVELAWDTFHQVVNMTAEELRTWLLNGPQDQPAVPGEPGPPLRELGLKVVQLLGMRKADLTGEDADVMLRVADFVTQEETRRPDDGPDDEQGPSQVRIAPLRAAPHHRATDPLSRAPLSRPRLFMPTR